MFRFAAPALWLSLISFALPIGAAAGETNGDFLANLTPLRAQRADGTLVRTALAVEIPGVTYPLTAPPDLRAVEHALLEATAPESEELEPEQPLELQQPQERPQELPQDTPQDLPKADTARLPEAAAPAVVGLGLPETVAETPAITLRLEVDLTRQRLTVSEGGEVKHVWSISSGRTGHLTGAGTFRPQWAARMWYSRTYDMAPMPHAIFFNGGIAFHATQATHLLGRPASHGCVRLAPEHAKQLYTLVHRHGFKATEIVVAGDAYAGRRERQTPTAQRRNPVRADASQGSPFTFTLF